MKLKVIKKETYSPPIVNEWVKDDGYNLKFCSISNHTFSLNLNLVYGDYDEFKKYLKQEFGTLLEHESCVAMVVSGIKDKKGIIWHFMLIQSNDWTAKDYGILAHETHHFVHFGLGEKGINYGESGEECFAYTQGYFMEMIVRAFVHLRRKSK